MQGQLLETYGPWLVLMKKLQWTFKSSQNLFKERKQGLTLTMKWYMKWIIYELRIWNQVKLWSSQLSNQLSYEATDVGSWSFVGSNGPVRNESMMKWYMKWIIYELRIWSQVKLWYSQLSTQFLQLRREAWKIHLGLQRGLNPWPRDSGATL